MTQPFIDSFGCLIGGMINLHFKLISVCIKTCWSIFIFFFSYTAYFFLQIYHGYDVSAVCNGGGGRGTLVTQRSVISI